MAYADDLILIRDNLVAEIKNETTRRKNLTDDGHPPPVTYTTPLGKTVVWNQYLKDKLDELAKLNELIKAEGDLYEIDVRAWT